MGDKVGVWVIKKDVISGLATSRSFVKKRAGKESDVSALFIIGISLFIHLAAIRVSLRSGNEILVVARFTLNFVYALPILEMWLGSGRRMYMLTLSERGLSPG